MTGLTAVTLLQLAVLWGWHAPPAMRFVMASDVGSALMQLSLFAVALWFWLVVLAQRGGARWRSIFALLVTGKLFCLLGVLLVFAPRSLYAGADVSVSDQQLAGLLMLGACPLAYVLASILMAARWLDDLALAAPRPRGVTPSRSTAADTG